MDATQLMALSEFLPTDEEKKGLLAYMERGGTSEEGKRSAFADLSECEKYMFTMIDVADAAEKFRCMLFRVQFQPRLNEIVDAIKVIEKACEEVRSSEKLRQILAIILTLVNEINTGGDDGNAAIGFSLEALLKLNEVSSVATVFSAIICYLPSVSACLNSLCTLLNNRPRHLTGKQVYYSI